MGNFRQIILVLLYLLPAGFLISLSARGLSLFDPRPGMNLTLRFLVMDLLPALWVTPFFGKRLRLGPKILLANFRENAWLHPGPLAAPSLALFLFIVESARAVLEPASAGPTALSAVFWMQAAAAFMAAIVLFYATRRMGGKGAWEGWALFWVMVVGGVAWFLATGCDISRLLLAVGVLGIGLQKAIRN